MGLNHRPHPYQGCALTKTELQTRISTKQFVTALPRERYQGPFCKEVIQPQVPLRLPCYDFTPVMNHTVVIDLLSVSLTTSGATHSHGVTGGVYKARERIHRGVLIHDY